jgi:beta-lactam-binding protein with PASTA domain
VGKPIADVRKPIEDAGFIILLHEPTANVAPAPATSSRTPVAPRPETGTIAKQSPAPGQRIAAGSNIFFEITH